MRIDIQQELWILMKFLVVEGMSGAEIHGRHLLAVFKSETLSCWRMFDWSTRFHSGCQSVTHVVDSLNNVEDSILTDW